MNTNNVVFQTGWIDCFNYDNNNANCIINNNNTNFNLNVQSFEKGSFKINL